MKKLLTLAVLALALESPAAPSDGSAPSDLRSIMQEFRHRMSTVKSVYMEYSQERVMKLFAEPLKTEGVMLISRPNRIRWETTAPYQTIMLGDAKSVAQFEFNNGKWEKLNLGFPQALQRLMQQISAMNQGDADAITADYNVTVTVGTETVLSMVPKNETVRGVMSSMEVHLSPDLAVTREVVMNEPNGDLTRITFRNEKRDLDFPAGTFDQNRPVPIAEVKAVVSHAP